MDAAILLLAYRLPTWIGFPPSFHRGGESTDSRKTESKR